MEFSTNKKMISKTLNQTVSKIPGVPQEFLHGLPKNLPQKKRT